MQRPINTSRPLVLTSTCSMASASTFVIVASVRKRQARRPTSPFWTGRTGQTLAWKRQGLCLRNISSSQFQAAQFTC
jgi:hypothetical protein